MDVEENSLCCGCLCAGRRLLTIDEFWKKQCFMQILNEIPMSPPMSTPVWLCWECEALVSRFTKFKKQVKHCYKVLNDYVAQNLNTSQLQRQPRITHSEPHTHKIIDVDAELDQTEETRDVMKLETEVLKEEIKEEDNVSTYSDNIDEPQPLIEYKSSKKKKKKEKKKRRKKEEEEVIQEVELTEEELAEERRMLASREEYVNAMFKCERCIVSFPNVDDMNDHVRIKHEANKNNYVCPTCACSFATEVSYNYHAGKHRRRLRCARCGAAFAGRRAAHHHLHAAHATEIDYDEYGHVPIKSDENGKTDETQESLSNNGMKSAALFPCELCDKTFRWKTSLRKHAETHRIEAGQKRRPYCEPCRLSFTTTSNLQKHVKTSSKHQIQLKLRKLTESLPGEPVVEQAHIEQIKRSVNSSRQMFPCAQCDKRFQWRGNLLRHLHSHKARAAGSLACAPCGRTFSSLATYTQHMRGSRKHVSEDDFKYMCSECGKRFANKTRLKDHVDWEHLKNYVHTCSLCQKVFKSHTSLYLHKQVVHKKDSADHLCDHCGKHFPNHAKLRSHIVALHSSTAPYKCSHCAARFSWHSCLSRHARRAHNTPTKPAE